jgi:hypothetical protein
MIRIVFAGALAGALAAFPAEDKELEILREALRAGKPGLALKALEASGGQDAWIQDAERLATLCEAAADAADDIAGEPKDAEKLVALLKEYADACIAVKPDEAGALRARAHATVGVGRVALELKKPVDAASLAAAVADFEAAHEKEPGTGVDLVDVGETLALAASLPAADLAGTWTRLEALLGRAVEKHPENPLVIGRVSGAMLSRLRLPNAKKEKGLDDWVSKALAPVDALQKRMPDDADLATAHNEAARLVRLLGLKSPKVEFQAKTHEIASGLVLDVPTGRHWAPPKSDSELVHQFTADFRTLRSLSFDSYSWATLYKFPDGTEAGGDNIKGITDKCFQEAVYDLKKVKAKRPIARASLRQVDPGWGYEVCGTDGDGDFRLTRGWFFKSKTGRMCTYEVVMLEYREGLGEDPAMRFVLDSIREKGK